MSRPHSDWLFQTLRGLSLLMLGWAFGAFYGLSGLGLHSIFLPVGTLLLGLPLLRASAGGWIVISCACVAAVLVMMPYLSFHPMILVLWAVYVVSGITGNLLVPRERKSSLRVYLLLLLMAVGAGMVWQAYPALAEGVFRRSDAAISSPAGITWLKIALTGLLAGLLGGFTHLGGGYVLIPALVLMGVSPHVALWSSLWLMLLPGLITTVVSIRRSTVSWSQEGWLGAGAFLGGVAGATWALSFSEGMLVLCFGIALVAASFVTWRLVALFEKATSTEGD